MRGRLAGLTGVLTGCFFFGSLSVLFILNPQILSELNNVSLASYNIRGMNGQRFAAISMYGISGVLNICHCVGFLMDKPSNMVCIIGKMLLTLCGTLWLSFGALQYDLNADMSHHFLIIRLVLLILSCSVGFLLLSFEYDRISNDRFLKSYTIFTSLIILLLSLLSLFVYNDETWVRTNISLALYFVWFTAVGLRALLPPRQGEAR
jgi:hypothetical protein